MDAERECKLTVYFSNGQKLSYRTVLQPDQVYNAGSRIENTLKGNYFGIRVDGKLVIIPLSNVQRVEFDPAIEAMISHVIPCAQEIDEGT